VVGTDGLDLRIRDGVGPGAPVYAFVPPSAVVTVVNGPLGDETGAPWYGIGYDGLYGWVLGEHLAPTAAAPSRRFPAGEGLVSGYAAGPPAADPARGAAVVDEALKHLDTPYVWGGDGPAGWDCSGMIQWLYWKVAGLDLPRVSQDQFYYGTPLRPEEVAAGDLVFFFDTDGPGITHNGIALGDGRFIHARSAAHGTVISRLDEPYWLAHYAGARRP
jgi:cell wall-associated NlpC family hydrolase